MSRPTRRRVLGALATGAAGLALPRITQAAGVVEVGMTTALSGPTAFLGRDVRDGVAAAFNQHNRTRAPGTPAVILRSYDDGYRPALAARNMEEMVRDESVLAVIGNVGTPTARVTVPLANQHGLPMFAPLTGAGELRVGPAEANAADLHNDWVFHYRASYAEEVRHLVRNLHERGIEPADIVLFGQQDSYGDAVLQAAQEALEDFGQASGHGHDEAVTLFDVRIPRNSADVEDAVTRILARPRRPRVVLMAVTWLPAAKLVRILRPHLRETLFASVSFVGARELAHALAPGRFTRRVVVTATVPPCDSAHPVVADFASLDDKAFTAPARQRQSPVALEGFVIGRLLLAATGGCEGAPTRAEVRRRIAAAVVPPDVSGLADELRFDRPTHAASSRVWTTAMDDERLVEADWDDLLGPGVGG